MLEDGWMLLDSVEERPAGGRNRARQVMVDVVKDGAAIPVLHRPVDRMERQLESSGQGSSVEQPPR
jgi:hypothetical protein